MLCHVTLLRWTDPTAVDERQLLGEFAALKEALPYLRSIQTGADLGFAEANYHYAVVAHFDDEAGWRQYQADPAHLKIAHAIAPNLASRVSAQFEIPEA
ncbi:Dabb family protein [Mycobacterium avium]|uniref:Dabb family protein n=1 Tax=Mycobacterium avium TaxID=1764 RepID=UPI001CC33B89|nr:Dabb family protein [Mycobacterium avium]